MLVEHKQAAQHQTSIIGWQTHGSGAKPTIKHQITGNLSKITGCGDLKSAMPSVPHTFRQGAISMGYAVQLFESLPHCKYILSSNCKVGNNDALHQ